MKFSRKRTRWNVRRKKTLLRSEIGRLRARFNVFQPENLKSSISYDTKLSDSISFRKSISGTARAAPSSIDHQRPEMGETRRREEEQISARADERQARKKNEKFSRAVGFRAPINSREFSLLDIIGRRRGPLIYMLNASEKDVSYCFGEVEGLQHTPHGPCKRASERSFHIRLSEIGKLQFYFLSKEEEEAYMIQPREKSDQQRARSEEISSWSHSRREVNGIARVWLTLRCWQQIDSVCCSLGNLLLWMRCLSFSHFVGSQQQRWKEFKQRRMADSPTGSSRTIKRQWRRGWHEVGERASERWKLKFQELSGELTISIFAIVISWLPHSAVDFLLLLLCHVGSHNNAMENRF